MKDSAFLGVRLGDGLKLETSALGLRTKVVTVIMLLQHSACSVLMLCLLVLILVLTTNWRVVACNWLVRSVNCQVFVS